MTLTLPMESGENEQTRQFCRSSDRITGVETTFPICSLKSIGLCVCYECEVKLLPQRSFILLNFLLFCAVFFLLVFPLPSLSLSSLLSFYFILLFRFLFNLLLCSPYRSCGYNFSFFLLIRNVDAAITFIRTSFITLRPTNDGLYLKSLQHTRFTL